MTIVGDKYYTPPALASRILAGENLEGFSSVVDPAAGSGELLKAALSMRPTLRCLAADSDEHAVEMLRTMYPDWIVSCVDLFVADSRDRSEVMQRMREEEAKLIVLNPPFSYRGGARRRHVTREGVALTGSPSTISVAISLDYCSIADVLLAILPISALHSDRDRDVRRWWDAHFVVEELAEFGRGAFPGATALTALVRFRRREIELGDCVNSPEAEVESVGGDVGVSLHLGRISMHQLAGKGDFWDFIHSTELRLGSVRPRTELIDTVRPLPVPGAAVLVPRVGRTTADKVVVFHPKRPTVLSDCVIAVVPERADLVGRLHAELCSPDFLRLYRGSCAPYVTKERVSDFLVARGWWVRNE